MIYRSTNYYFNIFLKKVFSLIKFTYTKKTSAPPWSKSNGGINLTLVIIGWMILRSVVVAHLFYDIQSSLL